MLDKLPVRKTFFFFFFVKNYIVYTANDDGQYGSGISCEYDEIQEF